MNLSCLIVDDDPMSRAMLERHCEKNHHLTVAGTCEDVAGAAAFLADNKIDLIFLDIEMPGANGFELLEQCSVMPHVIVTTSKENYAFEAYQYQVDDYLRKPIRIPRFEQAVQKILDKQAAAPKDPKEMKDIFIRMEGRLVKLDLDDLLFVENVGDYVKFVTVDDTYIVYSTLKALMEKLPESRFMKVHRSYIINLEKIVDMEENSLLINKHLIPVSRANKNALLERLTLI